MSVCDGIVVDCGNFMSGCHVPAMFFCVRNPRWLQYAIDYFVGKAVTPRVRDICCDRLPRYCRDFAM